MIRCSLVIPVKNEEKTISQLLSSLKRQTLFPAEVIIVDGGSTDNTKDIIKDNVDKMPFPLRLIETLKAYPGEGRNKGAFQSACDFIAFTDAGIILDDKWFEEITRPVIEDKSTGVVYGVYEPIIDSFIKECSLIAYVPAKENIGGRIMRTGSIASSLFWKKIFTDSGGFPPFRAAEDRIFMEKVKLLNPKIAYTKNAIVRWEIPSTVLGIFRRFSEFSMHDLLSGRMKDWHYSVLRTYLLLLLFIASGVALDKFFFLGALVLWSIRLVWLYIKKKYDLTPKFIFDPRYVLGISFLLLVTDAAMFAGLLRFLLRRRNETK